MGALAPTAAQSLPKTVDGEALASHAAQEGFEDHDRLRARCTACAPLGTGEDELGVKAPHALHHRHSGLSERHAVRIPLHALAGDDPLPGLWIDL